MRLCMKGLLAILAVAVSMTGSAFDIPKASAKALGVTKGKEFSSGVVFINGKYLPPPYRVERWGCGIRINGQPVTGQIVGWADFLATQSGVKVTKTEVPVAAPAVVASPAATTDADTSLDDLFDDDPKPKAPAKPTVVAKPRAPQVQVSYSLEGDFQPNETTKGYVKKINVVRTEIDRTLRKGGFIFFGDAYSRVSGDSRTAMEMMSKLPGILKDAQNASSVAADARAQNLVYVTDLICEDLYRNRVDYRKLQERHAQMRKEAEFNKMLNNLGDSLF